MLGNLCKYLCQPVPNLIPEGEKPLDSLTKLLVFHLNTKSAIQRIVVAEVVYYWALTQVKHGSLYSLLAHLSQRLIGRLIGYPWSGVRPASVRRLSVVVNRRPFTMLKDLLLQNRLANQIQILCGASLGRGNDILFAASGSPWVKVFRIVTEIRIGRIYWGHFLKSCKSGEIFGGVG